jgi:DNA primase
MMSNIEEVKQNNPMPEVVRRYGIEINRAGFCRCPFHNEKTASMKIYPTSFFCYGCGAGGDVIDFVRLYEHSDFKTAFRMLGGDFTGQSNKNVLSAYKRLADKRTKERQKARKAQALDDSRAMLEAYRNALNLIPADSPLRAALLAQYQNEQFNNEMLEEEYFKRGD